MAEHSEVPKSLKSKIKKSAVKIGAGAVLVGAAGVVALGVRELKHKTPKSTVNTGGGHRLKDFCILRLKILWLQMRSQLVPMSAVFVKA